jgi:NTP pyrophosphatase (non-canonical NTP hydrolase)
MEYLDFVRANLWGDWPKLYLGLALGNEAGELQGEIKKEYREKSDRRDSVLAEAGDVVFYLTALLDKYGFTLEDAMHHNVEKLAAKKITSQNKSHGGRKA